MQLTKEQSKQFEDFISKIDISKVRSDLERIWDEVKLSGYTIKSEQLDAITDVATHLPIGLQSYPQVFLHWVKNGSHTDKAEAENETAKNAKANLGTNSADILKGIKVVDKDISDNTISEFDDRGNKDAEKETESKKEDRKDLEEQAKAGDKERPVTALTTDTHKSKALESKIADKKAIIKGKKHK